MVEFDLGGVEDALGECNVALHAEEELDMVARVMELRPRTPSERFVGSGLVQTLCGWQGVLNIDIRSIQGTMIHIHLCATIWGI